MGTLPAKAAKSVQFHIPPADAINTMWCNRCRQDVPGVALRDGKGFCCPRCSKDLSSDGPAAIPETTPRPSETAAAKTPTATGLGVSGYDAWELEQQLRHIGRVLEPDGVGGRERAAGQGIAARFDEPHRGPSAWHMPPTGRPARIDKPQPKRSHSTSAALTWIALSLGTMAFVCGGMLLLWSVVTGREELWGVGMPVALCGQIALLVGLVLQLDRLWQDSRRAADKLDDVDEQLHDLKTTTALLSTTHSPSAGAFYAHLADGASPELLLNDLKGQLDMLAVKLGQQSR